MASTIISKGSKKLIFDASLRAAATNVRSSAMPEELLQSSHAYLSAASQGGKLTLPDLPYDYNALERKLDVEELF
jgi:hypothetical protein